MLIDTQRFILRDLRETDRTPFLSYQMDPQYLRLYDLDETYISKANDLFSTFLQWQRDTPRQNFQVGIFDRGSRLCGSVGLRRRESGNEAVFGIELRPADWGRYGLALEVASAMIEFGFCELGLDRIVGDTASGNRRIAKFAQLFGAHIVDSREGPQWMKARNWVEVDWVLNLSSWSAAREQVLRRLRSQVRPGRRSAEIATVAPHSVNEKDRRKHQEGCVKQRTPSTTSVTDLFNRSEST